MTPRGDTEESGGAAPEEAPKAAQRTRKKRTTRPSRAADDKSAEERLEHAGVLAALEAGISEALPGVEILDRNLSFDPDGRADLAAVDPMGRLVLVLVAEEDTDRAALETLDLLSYARENNDLVVRHLGSRRVDPGLTPRVVVIDPENDTRLSDRLGAVAAAGVEVFGVRTLRSAAGERSYLVAAGPEARGLPAGEAGVEAFLDSLPLPLQEVGRELTERMGRLDEDLFASADRDALVWRWNGEVLARVERVGERLTASVAPHHAPSTIRELDDVENVLEGALARLVVDLAPGEGVEAGSAALDREWSRDEPILTPEEIEAFED
jgi:hypothetical protein